MALPLKDSRTLLGGVLVSMYFSFAGCGSSGSSAPTPPASAGTGSSSGAGSAAGSASGSSSGIAGSGSRVADPGAGGSGSGGSGGGSSSGGSAASGGSSSGIVVVGPVDAGVVDAGRGSADTGAAPVRDATIDYSVSAGTTTIYLAGDSTVSFYPPNPSNQQGWGQRLQEFFTTNVVVIDKAIGGESSKSFIDQGHLTEIEGLLKPGDYLFAQWGINDRYTSDATRYTNPATTFRTYMQQYIDAARGKGANPVVITPTPRLDYANGTFNNDYVAYCAADQAVSTQSNTPLIDLQTKGLAYYTSVGIMTVQTTICLVQNNQANVLHFQAQGAYEMARLVAQGVQELNLPISKYLIQSKLDGG